MKDSSWLLFLFYFNFKVYYINQRLLLYQTKNYDQISEKDPCI